MFLLYYLWNARLRLLPSLFNSAANFVFCAKFSPSDLVLPVILQTAGGLFMDLRIVASRDVSRAGLGSGQVCQNVSGLHTSIFYNIQSKCFFVRDVDLLCSPQVLLCRCCHWDQSRQHQIATSFSIRFLRYRFIQSKCFYYQCLTKRDKSRWIRKKAKCRHWMEKSVTPNIKCYSELNAVKGASSVWKDNQTHMRLRGW